MAERHGDPSVLAVFRAFAQLREQLQPYLIEQARRSVESGRPLMRPLFFDHPDDEAVWQWPQQWQLGDDIMVSPVTEAGATGMRASAPAFRPGVKARAGRAAKARAVPSTVVTSRQAPATTKPEPDAPPSPQACGDEKRLWSGRKTGNVPG